MFLRILALIALLALPSAAWTQKGDDDSPPPVHIWTVRNQCREPIRIALNYLTAEETAEGGIVGRVVTRGWWMVPPYTEVEIRMLGEWIGYFAVSLSYSLRWSDPAGPKFGLDLERNFDYAGDGRRARWIDGFILRSVIERPIETLTCN